MSLDYQLFSTTKGHNNCTILHLKFSPDGNLLLSVAQDSSICLWDCRPLVYNQPIQPYLSFTSQQGLITSIAWCSINSEFITGGGDGSIQIWSIKDNNIEQSAVLKGHNDSITCIAAQVTNILTISSGSKDGDVKVWYSNGESKTLPKTHRGAVTSIDYSPFSARNLIITGGYDGSINLFDIDKNQCLQSWFENVEMTRIYPPISCVQFSPNGRFILVSSMDNVIRLFDLSTHKCKRIYIGHKNQEYGNNSIMSVMHTINCGIITKGSGSKDHCYIVSGSQDGNIWIWNLQNKKPVQIIPFLTQEEMKTAQEQYSLLNEDIHAWCVDFHPFLKYIVAGSNLDGSIKFWKSEILMHDDSDILSDALLGLSVS
ncbi:WD40 repeat-like protein [Piromyces finnis]|uniref:WD40 repeat-like protein n=1 Tax=Piromyces finnis TaxID=1754191 RepID=A0A1Y1UTW8_9FUNG|nr:WD40 repeat-like protein [Piromyces finnis]|eukprot:ORX41459.1 WD40 repeat-like protein [Piromyces finnis]